MASTFSKNNLLEPERREQIIFTESTSQSCFNYFKKRPSKSSRISFGWPTYSSLISRLMLKIAHHFSDTLRALGEITHPSSDWLRSFPTDWGPIKVSLENTNYANLSSVKMH